MRHKNIKRRDFTKLAVPLLAMLTVSGGVGSGLSREVPGLTISPEMARAIANLAQMIHDNLGSAASEISNDIRIGYLRERSTDLATLKAEISESIARDYDDNKVRTINGIVMADTEIAVVLDLNRTI